MSIRTPIEGERDIGFRIGGGVTTGESRPLRGERAMTEEL